MYEDIINKKYPFKLKHQRMSNYDRCKEFMPFSALTGYKDAVEETWRITKEKINLDEEQKEILDLKINKIKNRVIKPLITLSYFVKDETKQGGKYINETGQISKIDLYKGTIIINNKTIKIEDIIDIKGEIFDIIEN